MKEIVLVTLASFWIWETFRYAAQTLVITATVFDATRFLHPFLVLAFPLWYFWPDFVTAAAVSAMVGLLHQGVERYTVSATPATFEPRSRRRGRFTLP